MTGKTLNHPRLHRAAVLLVTLALAALMIVVVWLAFEIARPK